MQMLYMPSALPVEVRNREGKIETKMLRTGPAMEIDKSTGQLRLKAKEGGSVFRPGKGYCAFGLDDASYPVTVLAGDILEVNFQQAIQEPGWLGYHFIMGVPVAPTLFIINILRYGDSLLSGNVGANMYTEQAWNSPVFGHFVIPSTTLKHQYRNRGVADQDIAPSWALL